MSATTRSTSSGHAWSRFVSWLFSPPAGADLSAPISPSVYGYPLSTVFPRPRRTARSLR